MDKRMPVLLGKLASAITPGAAVTTAPNPGKVAAPQGLGGVGGQAASFGQSVAAVKSPATAGPLAGLAKAAAGFGGFPGGMFPPAQQSPPVVSTQASPPLKKFDFSGMQPAFQTRPPAPMQQQPASRPPVLSTRGTPPAQAPQQPAANPRVLTSRGITQDKQQQQAQLQQRHQALRSPVPFNRWASSMQRTGAAADAAAKARTAVGSTYQSPKQKYGADKAAFFGSLAPGSGSWVDRNIYGNTPESEAIQKGFARGAGKLLYNQLSGGKAPPSSKPPQPLVAGQGMPNAQGVQPGQAKPAPSQPAPAPAPAPQGGMVQQMGQQIGQQARQAAQPVMNAVQSVGRFMGIGQPQQPQQPSLMQRMGQVPGMIQQGVQQLQQAPGNLMQGIMGGLTGKTGMDKVASLAKLAAQADNAGPMKRSGTGQSTGLSFANKKDHYAQGPDAWASVSGYLKKKPETEPNPFAGKHA